MLDLRVQPGARRAGVEGTTTDADGTPRLKVALTAAPQDGKANAALIVLLAKRWKFPKSAFTIPRGTRSRNKRVLIRGDAPSILARIEGDIRSESEKETR